MRTCLKDITFVIAVRLDCVARLENTMIVASQLCKYFDTTVIIAEIADHCNGILRSLLPRRVTYLFIEDKDNVFFRTKYFNRIISSVETPIVALWDTDVVIDRKAIIEAVDKIRVGDADIAYPYNGVFLETSDIMRRYYLETGDVRRLHRNRNKLKPLYDRVMVGGAVLANREKYIYAGMENEIHYGWGNDDFDRFYRFRGLGYKIYRVNTPLFHLCHPRGDNSQFRSEIFRTISSNELAKIEYSSKEELEDQFCNQHSTSYA